MNSILRAFFPTALLLSLVGCAAADTGDSEPVNGESLGTTSQALATLSSTDWMNQMPGLATKKLNEVSFPGTHDSGTYGLIDAWNRPIDDQYPANVDNGFIKAGSYIGITKAWAKAQEKTVAEQLTDGIRAIDLRPCKEKSGTYRICHSLYGPLLSDALDDIATFSAAHPREVLIVSFGDFYGVEANDHAALYTLINQKIGTRVIDAATITPETTVGQVWSRNAGSVVVLYNDTSNPSTKFFGSSSWVGTWANSWDRDTMKQSLLSGLATARSNQFITFSGQATPDESGDLIKASFNPVGNYPSSLEMLADQSNPVVLGWVVNEWSQRRLNVMSFDFYNKTCLVKIAQQRNGANVSLSGCEIGTDTAFGNYAHEAYTRGAGTPMICAANEQMIAGLCYTQCAAGYSSSTAFPTVCSQPCPSGYRDDGLTCFRDARIISADTSSCPWYNKCGVGSSCNKCPSGYQNDGCTCRRDANMIVKTRYDRGVGRVPSSCPSNTVKDGALCYTECRGGFGGAGPVCWPQR